jgi:hypothetical protein
VTVAYVGIAVVAIVVVVAAAEITAVASVVE